MRQIQHFLQFFTTFTSVVFYFVFLLYLFNPDFFREFLLSLFPLFFGVGIVGFLHTYIYYQKSQQKYNLSTAEMILVDFFCHLLPVIILFIILYRYKNHYHIPWWILIVYLGLILVYILINKISYRKFWKIYPGLPGYVIVLGFVSTLGLYMTML